MAIQLIDKIKQKNNGTFKLVDASDINWDIDIPADNLPDDVPTKEEMDTAISQAVANAHHLKRQVVDALPEVDDADADTIYMVPTGGSGDSQYDEYMLLVTSSTSIFLTTENVPQAGGTFEISKITVPEGSRVDVGEYLQDPRGYYSKITAVGDTTVTVAAKDDGPFTKRFEKIGSSAVDLSGYATKDELNTSGANTLSEAKKYTDAQVTDAKDAAAADASTKSTQALNDAKAYTDQEKAKYLPLAGGTLTGKVTGVVTPTEDADVASKKYVDDLVEQTTPEGMLTEADFETGATNGTFKVKDKEVAIKGLGSAAFVNVADIKTDIAWNPIA